MTDASSWHIVKLPSGQCQIVPTAEVDESSTQQTWGPYSSQGDAIARRVGLIRAGQCQPS